VQYREFGKLDWKPSALGFGAMRLPTEGEESGDIDEERAIEMIRYAIDQGVNYVDTAWPYHDENSEELVAKALKDGYREKTRIATKLPSWLIEEPGDMDEYLDKQLNRLEVDQIDFYLLHTLNQKYWKNLRELGVFEWLDKVQDEGKIAHPGFSFHDDLDVFKDIVDSYDWTFCQIQYNYLDREFQAGTEGLKYASSRGLAVVIMEPLRGGKLAAEPPEEIEEIWSKADAQRGSVSWALNWLWDQPEVSVVLSGMSTLDQVKENVELADGSGVNKFNEKEIRLMEEAGEKYHKLTPVGCTGCNYCTPCPNDVEIPTNFQLYNEAEVYDRFEENKDRYYEFLNEEQRASACVACGQCEDACPQNLEIIDLLSETASYFGDR
jgi:hypothetical protein